MKNGKSAGGESADKKRAEETGSVGDGDSVNIVPGAAGVFQGFIYDRQDGFEVGAGGNLWDDATIFSEDIYLRNNDIR